MPAFLAVIYKELRLLSADPSSLILLLLLPFILVAVLSEVFEPLVVGTPRLDLPVVDLDRSESSMNIVEQLSGIDGFDVDLEQRSQFREADAEALFGGGQRVAALVIPAGFEDALSSRGEAMLTLHGDPARSSYVSILHEQLQGRLLAEQLSDTIARVAGEGGGEAAVARAIESAAARARVETIPASERGTFPSAFEQTVPGFAVMFGFFTAFYAAWNILREREEYHTWQRTIVSPMARVGIAAARLVAYTAVGVLQLTVMLLLGRLIWGMSLGDAPLALWLAIGSWSLVSASVGLLAGFVFREIQALSGVLYLSVVVLGALGGALLPVTFLPDWMEAVSVATPHYWAVDAIQDLIARGQGLTDILPHLAILLGFASAIAAGASLVRRPA